MTIKLHRLLEKVVSVPGFIVYDLEGEGIKVKQGRYSPVYINAKTLWFFPELLARLIDELKSLCLGCNCAIGIETGGSPLASIISRDLEIPLILVRKESKGNMGILVGNLINGGGCIAIIDDVLATGNSMKEALISVQKHNRKIILVSLISYGMDNLIAKRYGIEVRSLYQVEDILASLQEDLSEKLKPYIKNYQSKLREILK